MKVHAACLQQCDVRKSIHAVTTSMTEAIAQYSSSDCDHAVLFFIYYIMYLICSLEKKSLP